MLALAALAGSTLALAAGPAGATPRSGGTDAVGDASVVASGVSASDLVQGPDGNVWYTNPVTHSVGRVTPAGVITTYFDQAIVDPGGIAVGPDGNLWFTNGFGGNTIGRITPAGVVTTFQDGFKVSIPRDIVSGPDGNLWFANAGGNNIGRLTPAGVITMFGHATMQQPSNITAGPDGNLWFTNGSNGVSKITTDGVVTNYDTVEMSSPGGIVAGPDGALWYTDNGKIGRITTAGVVSTYGAAGVFGIDRLAVGEDGHLWFTKRQSSGLGDVTTAGTVTPHDGVAGIASPFSITAGPGGKLWVAQLSSIAAVTTGAVATVYTDAPLGDFMTDLVLGGDGNMWVLDDDAVKRVTPAGVVTAFTGPAITDPQAIVAGADGNLWFANAAGDSIGRITTAGVSTSFTTSGLDEPRTLTRGPDGNVWFASKNAVGKVTPAGAITRYPVTGSPASIAAGSDGNLWFVLTPPGGSANPWPVMQRITTGGTLLAALATSPVAGPPVFFGPSGLTAGPDGNLWFTETSTAFGNAPALVRMTTAGVITRFPDQIGAYPNKVVAGPDGNLWFSTSSYGGKMSLVRATPTGTLTGFAAFGWYGGPVAAGPAGDVWLLAERIITRVQVTAPATAPGAPTGVSAIGGAFEANVSWAAPASTGGSPITGYTVTSEPDGKTCVWTSGPRSCIVKGLKNGTAYTFTVTATNAVGTGPASAASAAVKPHFSDVPEGAAFYAEINWMANAGITTGYADGTFQPAASVSRQAMAAFLYRYAGSPNGTTPTCDADPFNDVPKSSPFCGAIKWMVAEGITNGYGDGGFHPNAPVARQAMSAFLYRFADNPNGPNPTCTSAPFNDVPIGAPFCGEIEWMNDTGISTGYAGNIFKPTANIARQAMAAFLKRLDDLP